MRILKNLALSILVSLLRAEWVRVEVRKLAARSDNKLDDSIVELFIAQADAIAGALEKQIDKPEA